MFPRDFAYKQRCRARRGRYNGNYICSATITSPWSTYAFVFGGHNNAENIARIIRSVNILYLPSARNRTYEPSRRALAIREKLAVMY